MMSPPSLRNFDFDLDKDIHDSKKLPETTHTYNENKIHKGNYINSKMKTNIIMHTHNWN